LDQIAIKTKATLKKDARYFEQFKNSDLVGSAWELDKASKKLRRKKQTLKIQSTADFFKNAGYKYGAGDQVWLADGQKAEVLKRVAAQLSEDKSYEVIALDTYGQRTGSAFNVREADAEMASQAEHKCKVCGDLIDPVEYESDPESGLCTDCRMEGELEKVVEVLRQDYPEAADYNVVDDDHVEILDEADHVLVVLNHRQMEAYWADAGV
jgi:hypothetical protein